MTGEDLRQKLQEHGMPLRQIAISMGITEQDFQSKLKAKDLKVSFVVSVAKAINKSIYELIDDETSKLQQSISTPEIQLLHHPKSIEKKIHQQAIKLYDVAAAANLKTLFDNKDQNILGEIMIPDIPKCDGAVYVNGDSMYPLLKSGDIIAYKEIHNFDCVIYGEMYLVSFDMDGNDFLAVKYINRSEKDNSVKLVSYNTHHDPMDIPIGNINALGLVKFSIRKNTMI